MNKNECGMNPVRPQKTFARNFTVEVQRWIQPINNLRSLLGGLTG